MAQSGTTDALRHTVRQGYDAMGEYKDKAGDLAIGASSNLYDFTRRKPWLALAAAFAIGYTMVPAMRRLLGRSGK
jgi:hypothetical protein